MSKEDKAAKPVTPEEPVVAAAAAPVEQSPDESQAAAPIDAPNPEAADLEIKRNENIPHQRLDISKDDVPNAVDVILEFAKKLEAAGERAFFEVHYPKREGMTDEEFAKKDAETFDAVEVIDGKIYTLPPYSELEKADDTEGKG